MQNQVLSKLMIAGQADVARIFSDATFKKGLSYANEGKVMSWQWLPRNYKNVDVLSASVDGSGRNSYEVKVYLDTRNNLDYMCTCPAYSSYNECKHGAAVFIMAISALQDPMFKNIPLRKPLLSNFEESTTIPLQDAEKNHFEIVLFNDARRDRPTIRVEKSSPVITIDFEIASILDQLPRKKKIETITKHLNLIFEATIKKNVLVVKTSQGTIKPVKLEKTVCIYKKLLLVSDSDKCVKFVPVVETSGGTRIEKFVLLGTQHILDLDTKIIYAAKSLGPSVWDHIADNMIKSSTENLADIYLGKIVNFSNSYNPLISLATKAHNDLKKSFLFLGTNGKNSLKHVSPRYSVHIESDNDCSNLILSVQLENETVSLKNIYEKFTQTIEYTIEMIHLEYCKELIMNQVFAMIPKLSDSTNTKNSTKIIAEAVDNISNGKHGAYINKNNLFMVFKQIEIIIFDYLNSFEHVYTATKDGHILYAPISNKIVINMAAQAHSAWPLKDQFNIKLTLQNNSILVLKKKSVRTNIRKFILALKKDKIAVFLGKKLLKVSKASISINAKRSDHDWFEIKPEIRVDDRILSENDWLNMINLGQHETISSIELVDEDTEKMLTLLKKYFSPKEGKSETPDGDDRILVETKPLKIFELLEFKNNKIELRLPKEEQEILDSLGRFKKLKQETLPEKLNATLRPYQHDGFSWLSFLYKHRFGACLADDMGLGKTVQTITFLGHLSEKNVKQADKKPHLIVLPPSLIFNWISEFEKFYPNLKVLDYFGAQRKDIPMNADVIVTTYDMIRIDIKKFEKEKFDVIIFDEAQAIKNLFSQRTGAVRKLNGKFKLCLTGTPLENNISEFYSIMDLALPGLLPEYEEFKSWDPVEQLTYAVERTRPFILRRKKEVILNELPEKSENDVYLPMTDAQKTIYKKIVDEIKNTISEAYHTKTSAQAAIIALTAILRLRQVCVSQQLVAPAKKEISPKIAHLLEKLIELKEEGHAALVFSQFTSCLDILENHLTKSKIKFLRIDGSVPVKQRKDIVSNFQNEKSDVTVLLLSLKTGGVGLNLTRANYVFHIDPWWNPAVENQASDRAYRIGQKQHVLVTRLLMKHSIEEKMMKLKQDKAELFAAVVEGTQAKRTSALSKKDFDFLLS